jgi:acyl carrier protein
MLTGNALEPKPHLFGASAGKEWDSHGHLSLILGLEAKFGVTFSPADIVDMI